MSLLGWVVVIAGVLVALLLLFFMIGTPGRRRAAKRERANQLRQEAEEQLNAAVLREATARQEQAAAERERLAAKQKLNEADAVDPDLVTDVANLGPRTQSRVEAADKASCTGGAAGVTPRPRPLEEPPSGRGS